MNSNLSRNLKTALERKGWSASELSRRSGVSKQNISSWLADRNPRSLTDLKKVAVALGLHGGIDELIFGSENGNSKKPTINGNAVGEFFDENGNVFKGRFEVSLSVKKLKEEK